jgi:hypothetical protein
MPYSDPAKAAEAKRRHYEANKNAWKARGKVARAATRQWVREFKQDKPCADCGMIYPHYVMDFDHRPGSGKVLDISTVQNYWTNRAAIQAELDKCYLVCANCHRIRSYERQQHMG